MAHRLAALGEDFALLHTPTGDEADEVADYVRATAAALGRDLIVPPGPTLDELEAQFNALPNNRQRWCTRMIKIVPCIAWLKAHPGTALLVGLRADEEDREGLYGKHATYRYPLREWGWGMPEVIAEVRRLGLTVPRRTDCLRCYDQRIGDWHRLYRNYPERWAKYEANEARTGHTYRSDARDSWPAQLVQLRGRFEAGERPKDNADQGELFDTWGTACRVCRL